MSQLKELEQLLVDFRDQRDWQQFHNPKDLAIALSLEASELLEAFLWKPAEEGKMEKVREELVDDLAIRGGHWVCRPEKRASSDRSIHGLKALLKRDPSVWTRNGSALNQEHLPYTHDPRNEGVFIV